MLSMAYYYDILSYLLLYLGVVINHNIIMKKILNRGEVRMDINYYLIELIIIIITIVL